jgi:hypothetical protein
LFQRELVHPRQEDWQPCFSAWRRPSESDFQLVGYAAIPLLFDRFATDTETFLAEETHIPATDPSQAQ